MKKVQSHLQPHQYYNLQKAYMELLWLERVALQWILLISNLQNLARNFLGKIICMYVCM